MSSKIPDPLAEEKYSEAHKLHYGEKCLQPALDLYLAILNDHADSSEAGFALSQIQNIVNSVVPKAELLEAHVKMVKSTLSQKTTTPFKNKESIP